VKSESKILGFKRKMMEFSVVTQKVRVSPKVSGAMKKKK